MYISAEIMNILFQISIGALPVLVIILLILIIKRAITFEGFVSIVVLIALSILAIYLNVKDLGIEKLNTNYPSKSQMMSLANSLLANDSSEATKEVITEYAEVFGYDDNCRLIEARSYALNGNYAEAKSIYSIIDEIDDKNSAESELSLLANTDEINTSELKNRIKSNAIGSVKEGGLDDFAKALIRINDKESVYDELATDVKAMNEGLKTNPKLQNIRYVDKTLVKSNVLKKEINELVAKLDNNSSYQRLMLISDLIMSGQVSNDNLTGLYSSVSDEQVELIKSKIELIKNNLVESKTLNNQQVMILNEKVASINSELETPGLTVIKNILDEKEVDKKDESKKYLQLSKIDNYHGNTTKSSENFNKAVSTSYKSEDGLYKSSMNKISTLLASNEANDDIKEVDQYVKTIYENSSIIDDGDLVNLIDNEENDNSFVQNTVSNVTKIKNAIYINDIDVSKFPNVVAQVTISNDDILSTDELEKGMQVTDCAKDVKFDLKKVAYEKTNIILALDVSGSMYGKIDDLKESVRSFIDGMNDNEYISIVLFDSKVKEETKLGAGMEELNAIIDKIVADGGTNIYDTTIHCLNNFESNDIYNNILIVMTDGEDVKVHTEEEINENIVKLAKEKNAIVYTIGFGKEVKESYLRSIGQFNYGGDGESLKELYKMLHRKAGDLYTLSFNAENTKTMLSRPLEIGISEKGYWDKKRYSLDGSIDDDSDIVLNKISPNHIYKDGTNKVVELISDNYDDSEVIVVLKNDKIEYELQQKDIKNNRVRLIVPDDILTGYYDVNVKLNNKDVTLPGGFNVYESGTPKEITFGKYKFVYYGNSDFSEHTGGTIAGNVTMNDWLHFNGDITIDGSINNDSVKLVDNYGAYIEFDSNSKGLASLFAKNNERVDLPKMNSFTIYKYEGISDTINMAEFDIPHVTSIMNLGYILHYNYLEFTSAEKVSPVFDILSEVFGNTEDNNKKKKSSVKKSVNIPKFEFPIDVGLSLPRISDKSINFKTSINVKGSTLFNDKVVRMFNRDINLGGDFELNIDTLENNYDFTIYTKIPLISTAGENIANDSMPSGIGVSFGLKNLEPDKLELIGDFPVSIFAGPVPITFSRFSGGVKEGLTDAIARHNFDKLVIKIGSRIAVASVKDTLKLPVPVIGNFSLLVAPDAEVRLRLSNFSMEADADLLLLGLVQTGRVEAKIGNFTYDNKVLEISNEDVVGLLAKASVGIGLPIDNFKLNLDGTLEATINTRFMGLTAEGNISYDIKLPVYYNSSEFYGGMAFGIYRTHKDKVKLVFVAKGEKNGEKVKTQFVFPSISGKLE